MNVFTKANSRVEVYETHNHLAGQPDGARMSWRSYLVAGDLKFGCSHFTGHRSREAATACGTRRFRVLPDSNPPDEATAGGLPR